VVVRTTHHLKSVKVTEETELLISSRPADKMNASQIQAFRRGHWGIERLHYVRDVTFGEDHSTVHTQHASRNMATLRHLVIGLCGIDAARQKKHHSSLPTFRAVAANDHQVAIALLTRPLLNGADSSDIEKLSS
jgi:predicted transposase YbfD/YdcC